MEAAAAVNVNANAKSNVESTTIAAVNATAMNPANAATVANATLLQM